jgi:hypothetical protein
MTIVIGVVDVDSPVRGKLGWAIDQFGVGREAWAFRSC